MPDISIQFYAAEEELSDWITRWAVRHSLHVVAIQFRPFIIKRVQSNEVSDVVRNSEIDRVVLLTAPAYVNCDTKAEFENKNRDDLALDVGRLTEAGLAESWLAARTEDVSALKIWRSIVKDLKSETLAGVTAINRHNGIAAYYPADRYSPAAAAMEANQIPMLPLVGPQGPIIKLGNRTT